ncbi:hypothetical protein V5799_007140 [Amblyomma americanum]|uniref:Uncharacterized protein n=1 Tax=Amblyomma americanum TaxID=6943 RepID=A0AAQ4DUD8_AMBAM
MHGFPNTRDNPAKAPYTTLDEEHRSVPTDGKRECRPPDPRYHTVAFLMAGVLVAAVTFLMADKTNKAGRADEPADNSGHFVVDNIYLELDQKYATDAKHIVTMMRNPKAHALRLDGYRLGSVIPMREESGLPARDSLSYVDEDDMYAARAKASRRQSADSFGVPGTATGLPTYGTRSTGLLLQDAPTRSVGALGSVLKAHRNDAQNALQSDWAQNVDQILKSMERGSMQRNF